MKAIFSIATLLLSVTLSFAQTQIALNSQISVEMPSGTVKFADTENLKIMKESFGEDLTKTLAKNTEVYKLDDIIFRFKVLDKFPANYIENVNRAFDIIYGKGSNPLYAGKELKYTGYQKISKNSGDGKVVYALYESDKKAGADFHYYNSLQKVAFSVSIDYPATDKAKILHIIDRLIETVIIK